MNLNEKVEEYLKKQSDKKYKEFNDKLNKDINKSIGVRIPILRKYAKELTKEYDIDYLLNNIKDDYYEKIMLKSFIIGLNNKLNYNQLKYYIEYFLPKITNWSLCDEFCTSLKIIKKYKNEVWHLINKYLNSSKEFEVRFSLVILLNYYIEDNYIDKIYNIINNVNLDKYYVKMANAWLISYCIIYDYPKTYNYLKNNNKIDKWTYNKAIQKSIESLRINKEQKEELKKLKK